MKGVKYLVGSERIDVRPMRPFNDEVCNFLSLFSEKLMHNSLAKKFSDIIALGFWVRKGNIQNIKNQYDLSNYLGRGLVFHITPSNIPVNFMYSYFFSLLAGNANIVRIPSKPFPQIPIICDILKEVIAGFPAIRTRTAFVSYQIDDEITGHYCMMADARIVWGGDNTVKHIRNLAVRPRCIDVVFPDRYSFCILDGDAIRLASKSELKRLAESFYNDTYLMDQNACSSPQIIFWQNAKEEVKDCFWNAIITFALKKYELQPAIVIDKYIQFCKDAVTYDNFSLIRVNGLLYRIIFSSLPEGDLTELRGKGGYFYEYDLRALEELIPYITEKYQTLTYYGIDPDIIRGFILRNQLRGIDRVVPVGSAMDIGVIWDGYDLINTLSRRISIV
jgi:hypothetical protein